MTTTMLVPVTDENPELAELPVLRFVDAPPGLPMLRRALLIELDDAGLLFELRPTPQDDDGTRLLVVPPTFFPDYAPVVDDETVQALGLETADDALLLLVVNLGDGTDVSTATANLAAPIIINRHTRRASQVVLSDADLPLRAPLAA